jgi:acyl-CoA synthetase (NDP forming)
MEILQSAGIPCYEWPERTARIAGYAAGYADYLKKIDRTETTYALPQNEEGKEKAAAILNQVSKEGRDYVLEPEVKEILSVYGIRVTKERVCSSIDEAISSANEIGYPVVLKVVSPEVIHKSDFGGVEVGIKDDSELKEAYTRILKNVQSKTPDANINGVSVQEMARGKEVIIGSVKDQDFGPLMVFGMGGIFVEAVKDVSYRLAPVTKSEAGQMIEEIRNYPLLKGHRGEKGVNLEKLRDMIARISLLLIDFPQITEMDLNPVFVNGDEAIVADGRMFIN